MAKSQKGGDIITKVILYYFFSVLLLIVVANISVWMSAIQHWLCMAANIVSLAVLIAIYKMMTHGSSRHFVD